MADTTASPNNARVRFRGKPEKEPMAKSAGIAAPAKSDSDYEAEDALRTMTRAEDHSQDKDLMGRVAKHVDKQVSSLSKVQAKLEARGLISPKQAEKAAKKRGAEAK